VYGAARLTQGALCLALQFFRGSLYNQRKLYHHLSESHAAMALRSATLHSAMEDCLGFLREQEEGDGAAGTGAAEPMDEDGGEVRR
jgi:hypothetical protein